MPSSRPQRHAPDSGASPAIPREPILNPGDQAPPGTPGTGEAVCPQCQGQGRVNGGPCRYCGGTGKVIRGVGGA